MGDMLAVVIFFTLCLLVSSRSQPSVLQSLARGERTTGRHLSNSEAAKALFESWYPISHHMRLSPGYDPTSHGDSETYGELEPEGIEQILDRIAATGAPLSKNDVFADLGSGVGQVALLVFLQASVGRVVGVELMQERHELAVQAREKALHALDTLSDGSKESVLEFFNGDIRKNAHWKDATVVFTCSTLFSDELIAEVRESLLNTLKPGALVFSLKPLGGNHKDLAPLDVVNVKVSWSPETKVFLYIRNLDPVKLKELNAAIAESKSALDDCLSWGRQTGNFASEELLLRFCYAFAWKWDERAGYGSRVDYDWVLAEL